MYGYTYAFVFVKIIFEQETFFQFISKDNHSLSYKNNVMAHYSYVFYFPRSFNKFYN